MTAQQLPTRIVAGVTVPSTPIVNKALELAEKYMDPIGYNHVVRSWLFATLVISRLPPAYSDAIDMEAFSVATILHDLGWSHSSEIRSKDKIFEVDGANAAREFILREGDKAQWDKHRIQLVWDGIALHTNPDIAAHKETEVAFTSVGVLLELFGAEFTKQRSGDALPSVTQAELDKIAEEYPRTGFKSYMTEVMCGFCREKPDVTYMTFVGGFGDEFLEGYSTKGKRAVDFMMKSLTD